MMARSTFPILFKSIILLLGSTLISNTLSAQTYFEEDFDSGLPSSWTIVDGGTSNDTWHDTTDYNGNSLDGTPFMHVNSNDAQGSDSLKEELISPAVNAGSANNLYLRFDHYFTNIGPEKGYIDVHDGSGWVQVASFSNDKGSWTNPATEEINITALQNSNLKVRFRYNDNGDWGLHWSVDNVEIFNKQCFEPTNLAVEQVHSNSAYVSWDSPYANSASWEVRFAPTGSIVWDTITTSNIPAAIGPLNPDTEYEFYVRELCINGQKTDWVPGGTFRTRCNTHLLPFSEDMESFSTNYDATGYSCWIPDPRSTTGEFRWNTNSGSTNSSSTGPDFDHTTGTSSGIYAYTEASSGSQGDEATLSSSTIDLSSIENPLMSFWYHMYGSNMESLHVDVSTDNGKSWDHDVMAPLVGEQQSSSGAPWKKRHVDLNQYGGEIIMVRFRGVNSSSFYGDMAIDDIEIRQGPADDMKAKSFISPSNPDCYSASHPVEIPIVNGGQDDFDFTQENVDVTVEVSGVVNQTLNTTITDNSLNGGNPLQTMDSIIVDMGTINMSGNGIYELKGYISAVNGDTLRFNDTTKTSLNVSSLDAGTVQGGGTFCEGDTAELSVTGNTRPVQWQYDDGNGWTDWTGPNANSTTLPVSPNDTTFYRVEVCGSSTSNEDTVMFEDVTPPQAEGDTFCMGVDAGADLEASGGGDYFWFETQSSEQFIDTGQSITVPVNYTDVTYWVSRSDQGVLNPVLITEVDNGAWSDGVEIQNVSNQNVDVSGWQIVMNEATPISDQDDSYTYGSGNTLSPEDNIRIGEANSSINLSWTASSSGWVILLDDNDKVRDMVFFGYNQSDIQGFSTTIGGNTVTAANHWSGDGVPSGCDGFGSGVTYSRTGNDDNNLESDWSCESETMGSTNSNIDLPFGGCRSERVPVTAIAENCTGIEDFGEERSFSLYPNPSDGRIFIEMEGGKALEGTVRIIDLKGRVVHEDRKILQPGRNEIDHGGLERGVYMVRFLNEEGNFNKKLVVN